MQHNEYGNIHYYASPEAYTYRHEEKYLLGCFFLFLVHYVTANWRSKYKMIIVIFQSKYNETMSSDLLSEHLGLVQSVLVKKESTEVYKRKKQRNKPQQLSLVGN
jgi:hypothetical protein